MFIFNLHCELFLRIAGNMLHKNTSQCKIPIVPEQGWFGQPKYRTPLKKRSTLCRFLPSYSSCMVEVSSYLIINFVEFMTPSPLKLNIFVKRISPWDDEIYLKTIKSIFSLVYTPLLAWVGQIYFLVEALGFSENVPHYLTLFESLGFFG